MIIQMDMLMLSNFNILLQNRSLTKQFFLHCFQYVNIFYNQNVLWVYMLNTVYDRSTMNTIQQKQTKSGPVYHNCFLNKNC